MNDDSFDAVIFDMDGVLVDSEPLHEEAFHKLFTECGHERDHGIVYANYLGRSDLDIVLDFLRHTGLQKKPSELLQRKHAMFLEMLRTNCPVFPALYELLPELRQQYLLAVASSSPHAIIHAVLGSSRLSGHFKAVVSVDDVRQSKPDPEIYQLAATRLGVAPSRCIVVEDAIAGVRAAQSAGMKVIGFTSGLSADELSEADFIAHDYDEIRKILLRK